MGRKAISGVPKTTTPLRILLTESERDLLDKAAGTAQKPTSTWARDTLLQIAAFTVAQQKSGGAATKKKAAGRPVKKPKA